MFIVSLFGFTTMCFEMRNETFSMRFDKEESTDFSLVEILFKLESDLSPKQHVGVFIEQPFHQ